MVDGETKMKTSDEIQVEMNHARSNVVDAEKEISNIKLTLRNLTTQEVAQTTADDSRGKKEDPADKNSLKFWVTKLSGLPDSAQPAIHIQLSNPVEKQTITSLTKDADTGENGDKDSTKNVTEKPNEQNHEVVTFYDVEISNATFELSVMDKDIPLGRSAIHDIKPLCQPNLSKDGNTKSTSSLDIAIVSNDDNTTVEAVVEKGHSENFNNTSFDTITEEEGEIANKVEKALKSTQLKDELNDEENDEMRKDETEGIKEVSEKESSTVETECPTLQIPTCVVTIKMEYTASMKDKKEKLYDLLNEASKRKAEAIDDLRKSAATLSRIKSENNGGKDSSNTTVIKSGFLGKKSKVTTEKETMFLVRCYQKYFGASSIFQRVFPIAKNYLLFFGGVAIMHFYGQNLALPPPV